MTRKEILKAIADNPNRQLYLRYGNTGFICLHVPTSKTALLKNAKLIHSFRVSTYREERPDLKPNKFSNLDVDIVTFDATTGEKNK